MGQHDDKLIAAHPGQNILGPAARLQALATRQITPVAHAVPQQVVTSFRPLMSQLISTRIVLFSVPLALFFVKKAPVIQARHGVMEAEVLRRLPALLPLGNVGDDTLNIFRDAPDLPLEKGMGPAPRACHRR